MNSRFYAPALIAAAALVQTSAAFAETKPDNSKQNAQIVNTPTGTADDQKNDADSLKTTQAIRKALVADDSLSTYAHNIKIITHDGAVTLKGPVRSADEKTKVESIAAQAAGPVKVSSEIEVSPK